MKPDNSKDITIGILGGMGVYSTAPFLSQVIEECNRQYSPKYESDYPHMIIYSLPVPFYMDRKNDEEEIQQMISRGLKKLESAGVHFVALPCNTVHVYYERLKSSISKPLFNMIDITVDSVDENSKRVCVLGTESLIKSKLYQRGLEKKRVEFVYEESWQQEVSSLIQGIKTNVGSEKIDTIWQGLKKKLKAASVDTVIVGCTDLFILTQKYGDDFKFLDSAAMLAKHTVKSYLDAKTLQAQAHHHEKT